MKLMRFKPIYYLLITLFICSCKPGDSDQKDDTSTSAEEEKAVLKAQDGTKKINGTTLYYKTLGEGEPVMVLHGGPGLFHDYLLPHYEELAREGYKLIFYDQRGSGKSAFPADTSTLSVDVFVEDLEAMRKAFQLENINLIGHDWGGLLAMYYATKYPGHVKKMVLSNPTPVTSEMYDKAFANKLNKRSDSLNRQIVAIMNSEGFKKRDKETFKEAFLLIEKTSFADESTIGESFQNVEFSKEMADHYLLVGDIMDKNFWDYDIRDSLSNISCPVLVVHGDMDNIPFEATQQISENISDSRVKVLKKCSHYPHSEVKKEFFEVIERFFEPAN